MSYIKWLTRDDWTLGTHLKKMDEILKAHSPDKEYPTINHIIELYVVCKYIEADIYPNKWSEDELKRNRETSRAFKGIIGKYFNSIDHDAFAEMYEVVDFQYKKIFWEVFAKYKLYYKFQYNDIHNVIRNKNEVRNILHEKNLVAVYGEELRKELLSIIKSAEWLLDEYEVYHPFKRDRLFFPTELTQEDKQEIIKKYIDSEDVHINYLQIIVNVQDNTDALSIGDRVRLLARKKLESVQSDFFQSGSGIQTEIIVSFEDLKSSELEETISLDKMSYRYDTKWIRDNLDEPTLLNNFIYLFQYIDLHGRITLVEKKLYKGIVEDILFMRSRHSYEPGYLNNSSDSVATLQMAGYYQQLNRYGKSLEKIIKWFFEVYLKEEFQINGFRMNTPSEHTTFLEKCRTMLSEMDGVLKQYNLYVEDGYVDQELFQISSSHMKFADCKSIVSRKYVYGNGNDFDTACSLLFSDQCLLAYVERIEPTYQSFYELLENEKVYDYDYTEVDKPAIDWLIEHDLIIVEDQQVKLNNKNRVLLLKALNDNDVLSFLRLSQKFKKELELMEAEGIVAFNSALFSRKEVDYFNFHLNKASFNNGNDLRNMYLHGSQPNAEEDEKIHENNYWTILKLFILCVLKINDEQVIADKKEGKKSKHRTFPNPSFWV